MPRVLPWLVDGKNQQKHARKNTTTKPALPARDLRTPSPGVEEDQGRNEEERRRVLAVEETPSHVDILRSSRSPPTSPIDAPPAEEYIKPGFDNDDMYIMVEDEFYAIAQQFTRHLHHAEYVRRKKQAKKMNASVFRDMARPVDGRTPMSKELLKRKYSEQLQKRQNKGLASTSRRPRTGDESDEEQEGEGERMGISDGEEVEVEEEEEEEEREDDPWYGTSLHTFMTSPRKNKSLVGLENIRSNTRAAAGFRSEVARPQRRSAGSSRPGDEHPTNDYSTATSSEDDDLEIIESRPSRSDLLPQSDTRVRTSLVKRESPDKDTVSASRDHTINKDQNNHRKIKSGSIHTATVNHLQQRTTTNEHARRKQVSTTATKPARHSTTNNRPRKRIFLDELDDIMIADNDNDKAQELSKNVKIQDQPRKLLSTSNQSRSTHHHTSEQQQQQEQEQKKSKSRHEDIPIFLV